VLVLLDVIDAYAREIPKSLVGIDDPIARLATAIEAYCRVIDRHRDGAVGVPLDQVATAAAPTVSSRRRPRPTP
jgi:hypothetical protein